MIQFEEDYFEIIEEIMTFGNSTAFKNNGNFNIFSVELNVDMLKEGFPLMKSHKLDIKNIIIDILGNIKGINNNKWFRENGCNRYIRYGLPFKEVKQVPKEDHELTDEYCSNKGEYGPTSQEYLMRFAKLKSISSKEGLALIDKDDITFWKDVVLKERGDLGVTRGLLWRKYPGINNEKIDQLRNAFEHLSSDNNYKSFTVHSQCPFLLPDPKKSLNENIALGRMGGLTSHVSHQYYTSSISTLDRVEIYNKRSKNKIKVKHDNIKEVDKHLNKLNIPFIFFYFFIIAAIYYFF